MNLEMWYQKRGLKFVCQRGWKLLNRYGLTEAKACRRIAACMSSLASNNASPTFPVPAKVIEHYPAFIHHLEGMGAEIAVHGYTHADLKACSPVQASQQLLKAVDVFEKHGLAAHGFRCPYLSCSDELIEAIPEGSFEYSSNQAIKWPVPTTFRPKIERIVSTLDQFYCSIEAQSNLCLPWFRKGMVEIPVCVPDDIQLFDGFQMSSAAVTRFWIDILAQVHQRGELFSLVFHPELFNNCIDSISEVVQEARGYFPGFWVAHLFEIAEWWLEKSRFSIQMTETAESILLKFDCTPRATILARKLDPPGTLLTPWMGDYQRINDSSLTVPCLPRPFIGISEDFPASLQSFLSEFGYQLESGENARKCALFLDGESIKKFKTNLELIDWIEKTDAPLLRYWLWPDGYRGALSLSGDLDALSIIDYSNRLFSR
jgi:peptidoglycan/xylan/chitin deacetylase (PgdA/CDA1 family)